MSPVNNVGRTSLPADGEATLMWLRMVAALAPKSNTFAATSRRKASEKRAALRYAHGWRRIGMASDETCAAMLGEDSDEHFPLLGHSARQATCSTSARERPPV